MINKSSLGTYLAAIINLLSSMAIWFFVADLLFKVDKRETICIFLLLFINSISKIIVLNSVKGEIPK